LLSLVLHFPVQVPLDPTATAADVIKAVCQLIRLKVYDGWGLYEYAEGSKKYVNPDHRWCDHW